MNNEIPVNYYREIINFDGSVLRFNFVTTEKRDFLGQYVYYGRPGERNWNCIQETIIIRPIIQIG
jgi:hypothetical protein